MSDGVDELEERRRNRPSEADRASKRADRKKAREDRNAQNQEPSSDAAGYGQSWGSEFRPGQNLSCTVVNTEPGGYRVLINKHDKEGFLPTQAILRTGAEVQAQFVCVHNGRILVSARFPSAPK